MAMEKLRNVPLSYRIASLIHGGISLFLIGVVFALVRKADLAAGGQLWAWVVLAMVLALTAAAGLFFALVAWGALSNPKSRLGPLAHKMPLQHLLAELAVGALGLFVLWLFGHT